MRFTTLAFSAAVLAVPFAAANAQPAPQGNEQGPPPGYEQGPPPGYDQSQQPGYDQGQKHQFRHLLSKEQHAMLREQISSEANGGGKKQIKEAIHQQMEQIASMSPDQQAQARNRLQAEWNALPAAEKQQLEQRIAERRERRQQKRQGNQSPQQYDPQQPGPQQYAPQGQAPQYSNDGDNDDE